MSINLSENTKEFDPFDEELWKLIESVDKKEFNFSNQIDLIQNSPKDRLFNIISVAIEHGTRGVAVGLDNIDNLVKLLNKSHPEHKNDYPWRHLVPICVIDEYGTGSLDTRSYSVISSKEKGAKEVEIGVPSSLLAKKDNTKLLEDCRNLINLGDKYSLKISYIIDSSQLTLDDVTKNQLCKVIHLNKMDSIVIEDNPKEDLSESILNMREFKNKTQAKIKMNIGDCSLEDLTKMVKGGLNSVGLWWNSAPNLIEEYSNEIRSNGQNS